MTVLMLGRQLELGYYRAVYLQSQGFQVIFPENKDEALAAIRAGGYDAVIISYTLSKESANEFVNLVKQLDKDCPVVAIMQERSEERGFEPDEKVLDYLGDRNVFFVGIRQDGVEHVGGDTLAFHIRLKVWLHLLKPKGTFRLKSLISTRLGADEKSPLIFLVECGRTQRE